MKGREGGREGGRQGGKEERKEITAIIRENIYLGLIPSVSLSVLQVQHRKYQVASIKSSNGVRFLQVLRQQTWSSHQGWPLPPFQAPCLPMLTHLEHNRAVKTTIRG
jgi:hypothetical protein